MDDRLDLGDPRVRRGFDEHRAAQLREWAKLSLREKLLWLDEADVMVTYMQENRARRRAAKRSGG